MEEPADAAIALTNPINAMMGKADMRIEEWPEPFYGGGHRSATHPYYMDVVRAGDDGRGGTNE